MIHEPLETHSFPVPTSLPALDESRIYIAGHEGLVGSALMRALTRRGHRAVVTRSFNDLDLRDQAKTNQFFESEKLDYVIVAAARVGGIQANIDYPAEFLYDNLLIAAHTIHAAHTYGVKKLLFLGSSCIYPRMAENPLREEFLLTGPFEPTNAPYALAKVAGIKLCEAYRAQYGASFISCLPTNLYGPGDTFDRQRGHVIPALIKTFSAAVARGDRDIVIWGTGTPRREFLHADDCAEALLHILVHYDDAAPINVGSGEECTIQELAELIAELTGYTGTLSYDDTKPDGIHRKYLDTSVIRRLGWSPRISLRAGLAATIAGYRAGGMV
jgi:GDP-L-fucose synthase